MIATGLPAQAATITYEALDLADMVPGQDLWQYNYSVVNGAFSDPKVSATVSAPGDGYTRNWQLAHFLKEIIREFRGE